MPSLTFLASNLLSDISKEEKDKKLDTPRDINKHDEGKWRDSSPPFPLCSQLAMRKPKFLKKTKIFDNERSKLLDSTLLSELSMGESCIISDDDRLEDACDHR